MKLITRVVLAAFAVGAPIIAHAAITFDYTANVSAKRMEVFDNGRQTYFQVRDGTQIKQVYAVLEDGSKVPVSKVSADEHLIGYSGIYNGLELLTNKGKIDIKYVGPARNVTAFAVPNLLPASRAAAIPVLQEEVGGARVDVAEINSIRQEISTEFGTAKPAVPVQQVAKAQEKDLSPIPFARGSSKLGFRGRQAVKEIAAEAKKSPAQLNVVIFADSGKDMAQSKARGISVRDELARLGVTNVKFLDGGVQKSWESTPKMVARLVGGQTFDSVLSAQQSKPVDVAPSFSGKTAQAPREIAAPQSNFSAPIRPRVSGYALKVDESVAQQVKDAQADAEYDGKVRDLTGLLTSGTLSATEFDAARKRLAEKRDATKAANAAEVARAAAKVAEDQQIRAGGDDDIGMAQSPQTPTGSLFTTVGSHAKSQNAVRVEKGSYEKSWKILATDKSVKDLLTRWANQAGWNLVWEYQSEVSINAPAATIHGQLQDAVNMVLANLKNTEYGVQATFYEANRTVLISAKE